MGMGVFTSGFWLLAAGFWRLAAGFWLRSLSTRPGVSIDTAKPVLAELRWS